LLKSCAMPPASWPIASILLICCDAKFFGEELRPPDLPGIPARGEAFAGFSSIFRFARDRKPPGNRVSADTNSPMRKLPNRPDGGKGELVRVYTRPWQLPTSQIYSVAHMVSM
jgi:hypothetical protein